MQTITNLKQLNWIPPRGEHRISINVAKVSNLGRLWNFAESLGFHPELIAMVFPNRVEIQLLLLQEQLEPDAILGFDYDPLIDRFVEVEVPDDAIRHSYGGKMSAIA
ncbi:MAG: hypothetical protein HC866_24375 [Leptolyngbyaceae cyanobacterium RU_5_1]|nr:hypothetical protein [Leptolyngbyaceae cyanobacterium RU_5_1]